MKNNGSRNEPWSNHVRNQHKGQEVAITVCVLAVERNLQERKIKEALLIKKLKPSVNIRNEMATAVQFIENLPGGLQ